MAVVLRHLARGAAAAILCLLLLQVPPCAEATGSGGTGTCIIRELDALLSFKAGLLDPAGRLLSWQGEDCCQWKGVRCSNKTGHVVKLDLRNKPLVDYNSLFLSRDEMAFSLAALQHLRYLDLSGNYFNGTNIPMSVGSLAKLRYLNLSFSGFGGTIPSQLGNLSSLQYLDVGCYSGEEYLQLQAVDLAWLSGLSSLIYLDFTRVNLSPVRDWVHMVNMLASLRVLRLKHCGLNSSMSATTSKSNLTHIEVLDLSHNWFRTSLKHNWFWDHTSLKELYLSDCFWHGSFPEELGNMSSLEVVSFSSNNLVGLIPSNLQNLCNLEALHFEGNNINANVGEFMERLPRCSWSTIQVLSISYSNMTGKLPIWMGNMTSLTRFDVSGNRITGTVPLGIGALGNLTLLDLSWNKLNGGLTKEHFSGLFSLETLCMDNLKMDVEPNWVPPFSLIGLSLQLSQLGPHFPRWLRWQTNIVELVLRNNANLNGVIPDWFWVTFSRAVYLDLSRNKLHGSLPASLQHMSAETIYLASNNLTGQVPHLPIYIIQFDLSSNSISGSLPSDLKAPLLIRLLLANNQIAGTIPSSMCQLTSLEWLDLSGNNLTGDVMECWNESDNNSSVLSGNSGDQFGSNMYCLALSNNDLSGEFPKFLQSALGLYFLDLSYNRLSGALPNWLPEKTPDLQIFMVRSNMFSGHIPKSLTCLESLYYLDIASNNISGTIPWSPSSLKAMRVRPQKTKYYVVETSMPVTTKGQTRNYIFAIYSLMVNLDLSFNSLTGQIPEEISLLIALTSLNLSRNQLFGRIPNQIDNLKQLESLDLSYNLLSGEIPPGLSALTSLSHLNLSYNNLSGPIPSGPQLQALDNQIDIYIGNPSLCGYPLSKNCSTNTTGAEQSIGHEDADHVVSLYLGMSIGFVVGLWTVFCTMLTKRDWAIAYFQIIEKLFDEVYVRVAIAWARLVKKTRDDTA